MLCNTTKNLPPSLSSSTFSPLSSLLINPLDGKSRWTNQNSRNSIPKAQQIEIQNQQNLFVSLSLFPTHTNMIVLLASKPQSFINSNVYATRHVVQPLTTNHKNQLFNTLVLFSLCSPHKHNKTHDLPSFSKRVEEGRRCTGTEFQEVT